MMRYFLGLAALAMLCSVASAEDCNTSCGDQCRVKIPPPKTCVLGQCIQVGGGVSYIDPNCNSKCETFKKAACIIGRPLPTIPLTPREVVEKIGTTTCTLPFHVTTQAISSTCGFSRRPTGAEVSLIEQAKSILITGGFFGPDEFNGVSVYWCDLPLETAGIVPDRDLVYLHSSLRTLSPAFLAPLLAHEMTHVRQYRKLGSDMFKCDYVRQYAECLTNNVGQGVNCQDRNHHSMEHEAYEFQDYVGQQIAPPVGSIVPGRTR
jgi:hypothetical protein